VGQRYVLIPAATLETFPLGGVRAIWPAAEKTAMTRALHGAVRLLARHAPIFLPWVGRVLRGVVPVAAKPSMIHSGGDQDHPGVVYLSFGCPPAALAEMLVHEGTHQYYHLLTCLGPLEDGSDSTLYYSPIKRTGRQIGMILLAYHAFANVLLFYRLCRRNGFEHDGYIRHNEDALVPQLDQLEAALRTTRALTPLGRALWEPLAERIR
jgi:HEXXH motif-containing protein